MTFRIPQSPRLKGAVLFLLPVLCRASGDFLAADVIDMTLLGDRGVVFLASEPGNHGIEAVQGIGDVDGDRFGDLLLSVDDKGDGNVRGAAVVIYGRPGLTGRLAIDAAFPRKTVLRFGSPSIAAAGDINRDGYNDFLLGLRGQGYLVYGGRGLEGHWAVEEIGDRLRGVVFWSSDREDTQVGWGGLPNIGDFNGDGREDLAVLARLSTRGGTNYVGRLYILFRSDELPGRVDLSRVGTEIPGIRILGAIRVHTDGVTLVGENLGYSVTGVGDVDGDGFGDVLVKAGALFTDPARTYLLYGSANPATVIDLQPIIEGSEVEGVTQIIEPGDSERQFTGAALGDLNGDGLPEMLFGSHGHYSPLFKATKGAAFILYGSRTRRPVIDFNLLPPGVATKFVPENRGDHFGASVAPAGDLNLDGIPDFLVGASRAFRDDLRFVGEAYLIFGANDFGDVRFLEDGFSGMRFLGEEIFDHFGEQVGPAGDFNGDKFPDFFIVAPNFTPPIAGEGRAKAYLVYGTGNAPVPLKVISLEPAWGRVKGGEAVLVRGQGFAGRPVVRFGARESPLVEVISSSELRVVTPPGDGLRTVDVEVAAGPDRASLSSSFEYVWNMPEVDLTKLEAKGFILEDMTTGLSDSPVAMVDFNGDGVDDLFATWFDGVRWKMSVVRGRAALPPSLPADTPSEDLTVFHSTSGLDLRDVFSTADVNGDRLGDVVVASPNLKALLFGREDLPSEVDVDSLLGNPSALVRIERAAMEPFNGVGNGVVPVGDLTGDGLNDFAIADHAARVNPADSPDSLKAAGDILFVAGRRDWPERFDLNDPEFVFTRIHGSRPSQLFGTRLGEGGDVNGDGLADLVAVTQVDSSGNVGRGYVIFVQKGMPVEVDVDRYVTEGGGMAVDLVGGFKHLPWLNMAGAGDIDGDGFGDVLLGAQGAGMDLWGMSYLVYGGPRLPAYLVVEEEPAAPDGVVRIRGEGSEQYSGTVGPAGDFDGDGRADFVIGTIGLQGDTGTSPGSMFLIFGEKDLPERMQLGELRGHGIRIRGRANEYSKVGGYVGKHGDLNGDGRSDFVFTEDVMRPNIRSIFVVYGQGTEGWFVRGDANRDGRAELSDAVFAIDYLFLGGTAPGCDDAVDTDDLGTVDLTDAIYLLNHLFLGGPAPPPPYPAAGTDPTADGLGCRGA